MKVSEIYELMKGYLTSKSFKGEEKNDLFKFLTHLLSKKSILELFSDFGTFL